MDKEKLKTLASLGLLGGLMLSVSVVEANNNSQSEYYSQSCGGQSHSPGMGHGGCGGKGGCGGNRQSNGQKENDQHRNHNKNGPQASRNIPYYNPQKSLAENEPEANGNNQQHITKDKNHHNGVKNEGELLSQLNPEGTELYHSLSAEGKALAQKLAHQECKGKNDCKGLNSCKTEENSCAGHGGCKGQSNCNFKDKNEAVKVAAMKMAEKRNNAIHH